MAKKNGEAAPTAPESKSPDLKSPDAKSPDSKSIDAKSVVPPAVSEPEKVAAAAVPEAPAPDVVVAEAPVPEVVPVEAPVPEAPAVEVVAPLAVVPKAVTPLAVVSKVAQAAEAVGDTARRGVASDADGLAAGFVKTQADIRTGVRNMVKTVEEIFAFGQGNVEAFVKSSQIWTAGVQDLSKAVAATAQAQLDHTFATVKALAAIKSVKEVVDLQTNLARESVEKAVAETGKLTDASVKLAEQAWAPINERVTLAVEKFGRAA